MLTFLVLACSDPEPVEPPPETGSEPVPQDLVAVLEADGFLVQHGTQVYFDHLDCCARPGFCLYNNPTSPYGYVSLPPGPDQTGTDLEPTGDGHHMWFHLRRDEAIVLVGNGPPEARYFSFRSYLATRTLPNGFPQPVLGSLGPSMNQLVLADEQGEAPWGQPYAIVSTADREVETRIHAALAAAGIEARRVHDDRIPTSLVKLGLGPDADRLLATSRIAAFADSAAGEAWLADPGVTVLRLTPVVPVIEENPHPVGALPPKGAGTDEQAWAEAVDALEQAIVARWADRSYTRMESTDGREVEAIDCLSSLATCGGDLHDRYHALLPGPFRLPDEQALVVAFGTNHQRTGKASYANVSVDTAGHLRAIDGIDSDGMVGSAAFYLPDHPTVADLYAVTVARSCAGHDEACIEVPVACPGSPLDADLGLSFRAYLEPATGAAPVFEELVPDRALVFGPP